MEDTVGEPYPDGLNLSEMRNTEDLLLLTIITIKGTRIGPGSVSRSGNRLLAMALLAKWGAKRTSPQCVLGLL